MGLAARPCASVTGVQRRFVDDLDALGREARLQRVFADDKRAVRQLLSVFREQSQSTLLIIREARKNDDRAVFSQEMRKLRSTARSVGAENLAEICEKLATMPVSESWSHVDSELERFEAEIGRVLEYTEAV